MGKKERDFAKAKKEINVNNDLPVTVHNSAPVNINCSSPLSVNNSSVTVHNNFVNKTHTIDNGQIADPSSYVSTRVSPL